MNPKVEILNVGYAKIFIDRTGSLDYVFSPEYTSDLTNFYYETPGALQWNYYWFSIVTQPIKKSDRVKFESDCTYCRKAVLRSEEELTQLLERFPLHDVSKSGTVYAIKTTDVASGTKHALRLYKRSKFNTCLIPQGLLPCMNEMEMLTCFDIMRASVLNGQSLIYACHNPNEFNLFEKKMKFLGEKFKIVTREKAYGRMI